MRFLGTGLKRVRDLYLGCPPTEVSNNQHFLVHHHLTTSIVGNNPKPKPNPKPDTNPNLNPNPHPHPNPNTHPHPHPQPHPHPNPNPSHKYNGEEKQNSDS